MLEHSGGGSIINITSTMGRLAGRGFAAYGTAKAALAHYTRLAALDLCPRIRVNAIAPGSILTSALDIVASNDELREPMEKVTPDAHGSANPSDIAAAAVYLASPAGSLPDRQDARGRRRPHLPESRPAHPGSVRSYVHGHSRRPASAPATSADTALAQLHQRPRFELTGVWVSSDAKAGKDAAELAGLDDSTGITATTDLDAVLATNPECAVYTAMADNRLPDALEDYRRILSAGVNVVGSSAVFLQYPWQVHARGTRSSRSRTPHRQAIRACSSTASIPASPTTCCPLRWRARARASSRSGAWRSSTTTPTTAPTVMFDVMGFGKPIDEIPMLLQPGVLSLAWGSVVRQLAAGLGISLDEVSETYVREPAPEDFDIASGHIPKGSAAALRFEVRGMRRRQARRRARTRHPVARRPVPGLAAARPGGRLLSHRDHR